jgi:hypothetical protein
VGHSLFLQLEIGPKELKLCGEEEVSLLKFSALCYGTAVCSFYWLGFKNPAA